MSAWATIGIWVVGIIGSGVVNFIIIGIYIGKYQTIVEEIKNSAEESRKSLINVREDVARIKGRMNFKQWTKET